MLQGLTDVGSERYSRVNKRLAAISSGKVTAESKTSEAQAFAFECMTKLGVFGGDQMDMQGAGESLHRCISAGVEAGPLFDVPTFREYMGKVYPYQVRMTFQLNSFSSMIRFDRSPLSLSLSLSLSCRCPAF